MSTGITTTNDLSICQDQIFTVKLTGQDEVPPTNSQMRYLYKLTGDWAEFTILGDSVEYTVNASGMQGVMAGLTHSGKQGENGPVMTLFKNE